jgi:hypothetical protein
MSVECALTEDMVRNLHSHEALADRLVTHMLTRNIRIEEDLIDQLFNSSEKTTGAGCWCSPGMVNPRSHIARFRDCLMKKLTRERVVPTISARVS